MVTKTSKLTGPALDWAVAKAEGWEGPDLALHLFISRRVKPSIDWSQGGPIIEREGINITTIDALNGPYWEAHMPYGMSDDSAEGPTPLIAAMRCYVASVLGDEVEVPEEIQ